MGSRNALVRQHRRPGQIAVDELMPPERHYRPNRTMDGTIVSTFFFVFASVFALLWLSASLVPVFLLVTIYFARTFVQRASHAAAVQKNQTAVNLLNAGRIDDAAAIFDELTQSERNTPAHAVYVFNRAVAYMLQGRPRRAYSLFNAVLRSHAFHFGFSNSYLPLLYVEIATCLALMGELVAARGHRDTAMGSLQVHERGRVVFLDALLLARMGNYNAAAEVASARYKEAEALLRVPTCRALRLVHAYALARDGRRHSGEFRTLLDGIRPSRPGEFDWIAVEWPEFGAFLADHGL